MKNELEQQYTKGEIVQYVVCMAGGIIIAILLLISIVSKSIDIFRNTSELIKILSQKRKSRNNAHQLFS